jgi:hypothetical protein
VEIAALPVEEISVSSFSGLCSCCQGYSSIGKAQWYSVQNSDYLASLLPRLTAGTNIFVHGKVFSSLSSDSSNKQDSSESNSSETADVVAQTVPVFSQKIITRIEEVAAIELPLNFSMPSTEDMNEPNTAVDIDDKRLSVEAGRAGLRSILSKLAQGDESLAERLLDSIGDFREYCASTVRCVDRKVIDSLERIASIDIDAQVFLDALTIEKLLIKNFARMTDVVTWEWYCRDFGTVFRRGTLAVALYAGASIFDNYEKVFSHPRTLGLCIQELAKRLRNVPDLAGQLTTYQAINDLLLQISDDLR